MQQLQIRVVFLPQSGDDGSLEWRCADLGIGDDHLDFSSGKEDRDESDLSVGILYLESVLIELDLTTADLASRSENLDASCSNSPSRCRGV